MKVLVCLAVLSLVWVAAWRPLVRAFARCWGTPLATVNGVELRHAPNWFRLPLCRGMRATTLDRTILLKTPDLAGNVRLLRHEMWHVAQWAALRWMFPPVYVYHHVMHGYDGNPLEIEAHKAMDWKGAWE